jgi:hypothetical protein
MYLKKINRNLILDAFCHLLSDIIYSPNNELLGYNVNYWHIERDLMRSSWQQVE